MFGSQSFGQVKNETTLLISATLLLGPLTLPTTIHFRQPEIGDFYGRQIEKRELVSSKRSFILSERLSRNGLKIACKRISLSAAKDNKI